MAHLIKSDQILVHKTLKRKLRSATSPEEAQAFGIAIVIKEAEKDAN